MSRDIATLMHHMFQPFRRLIPVLLGFVLVASIGANEPKAQSKRPLTVAHWMDGVVRFHYTGLRRKLDSGPGPTDDRGWKRLEMNAAILHETSFVLVEDGRARDEVWRKSASETLRKESLKLVRAIQAKDLAKSKTALKQMGQSCVACHKVHRPEN